MTTRRGYYVAWVLSAIPFISCERSSPHGSSAPNSRGTSERTAGVESLHGDAEITSVFSEAKRAFSDVDFDRIASLACKSNGPDLSTDDAKRIFTNSQWIATAELVREERVPEDDASSMIVVRHGSRTAYLIAVAVQGKQRLLTDTTHTRLVVGEYPVTDAAGKGAVLNELAWFYATNGIQVQHAIKLAVTASELAPTNGTFVDTLAWSHFRNKEYEKAYVAMERLADKEGHVDETRKKRWDLIRDSLPEVPFDFALEGVADSISTKNNYYDLTLKIRSGVFLSINQSPWRQVNGEVFQQRLPLKLGQNNFEIAGKLYLFGRLQKSLSIQVIWEKYIDNADGSITDLTTGLMWTKGTLGQTTWVELHKKAMSLRIGGYSDWRMPTRNELLTVVAGGNFIDTEDHRYFVEQRCPTLLTSESASADYAWAYTFLGGRIKQYGKWYSDATALAVRTAQRSN